MYDSYRSNIKACNGHQGTSRGSCCFANPSPAPQRLPHPGCCHSAPSISTSCWWQASANKSPSRGHGISHQLSPGKSWKLERDMLRWSHYVPLIWLISAARCEHVRATLESTLAKEHLHHTAANLVLQAVVAEGNMLEPATKIQLVVHGVSLMLTSKKKHPSRRKSYKWNWF